MSQYGVNPAGSPTFVITQPSPYVRCTWSRLMSRSASSDTVNVGDHFVRTSAAPGFPPNEAIVEAFRDLPGWVTVRHYPGRGSGPCQVASLLNPKLYRRITAEDLCEAAEGLIRPCGACYGCVRWEHLHEEGVR